MARGWWATFWSWRSQTRLYVLKAWGKLASTRGISLLESVHLWLFACGVLGGDGKVPSTLLLIGYLLLVAAIVVVIDLRQFWLRERPWFVAAARGAVYATASIYLDSVGTYMVAVTNEYRRQNIVLQDNVDELLKEAFKSWPFLEIVFLRVPELDVAEGFFHTLGLAVFACIAIEAGKTSVSLFEVTSRAAYTLGTCRLLRILCYTSTVKPSQVEDCFVNRYDETYSLREHLHEAVSHWRIAGGCNDLLYSGHVVVLCLAALLYHENWQRVQSHRWLAFWMWWRLTHASFRIVYSHMHMSVDLIVGIFVTVLIWWWVSTPRVEAVGIEDGKVSQQIVAGLPERDEEMAMVSDAGSRSASFDHDMDLHTGNGIDKATTPTTMESPPPPPKTPSFGRREREQVRWWLGWLVLTAVLGVGLLVLNAEQAGPLSIFNAKRLQDIQLKPAMAAPAVGGEQPPRLFCAMMHLETSYSARRGYADAVGATWGARCNGLVMWDEDRSDIVPLDEAASVREPSDATHRRNRWLRTRRLLRYIQTGPATRYDWFVFVDDGGFVVAENFRYAAGFLEGQAANSGGAEDRPLYVGGGWGFAVNRAALAKLLRALDSSGRTCPGGPRSENVHALVHDCLASEAVSPTLFDVNSDLRTALGCQEDALLSVNLKSSSGRPCRYAVLSYLIPSPRWMYDVQAAIYKPG